jgi:hypothetical protein
MIKTLLLILALSLTTISQSVPDLSKFAFVGTNKEKSVAALVHTESRDAGKVLFTGMLAHIVEYRGDMPVLDPNNYSLSVIFADCTTKAYAFRSSKGLEAGVPYSKDFNPNTNVAIKDSFMDKAIDTACKPLESVKGKDAK